MAAVSKPSSSTMQKHSANTNHWNRENGCRSMNACTSTDCCDMNFSNVVVLFVMAALYGTWVMRCPALYRRARVAVALCFSQRRRAGGVCVCLGIRLVAAVPYCSRHHHFAAHDQP